MPYITLTLKVYVVSIFAKLNIQYSNRLCVNKTQVLKTELIQSIKRPGMLLPAFFFTETSPLCKEHCTSRYFLGKKSSVVLKCTIVRKKFH